MERTRSERDAERGREARERRAMGAQVPGGLVSYLFDVLWYLFTASAADYTE